MIPEKTESDHDTASSYKQADVTQFLGNSELYGPFHSKPLHEYILDVFIIEEKRSLRLDK